MIVRRDEMRASKIMQQRVLNTPNIEVYLIQKPMKYWVEK
jgi:thioredoxin reductase